MFSLNDLHKTQRGGVALRATFAALIALGSIPGAAAVSPNFSNVAFAATSDSSFSDTYIDNLTTAADWRTLNYSSYSPHWSSAYYCHPISSFSSGDLSTYNNELLNNLKVQLRVNTTKKEIPINCAYKDIEDALKNPDQFYALYTTVTKNLGTYTKCSDINGFKDSITSNPNNDTDIFLHDKTASLLENSNKDVSSYTAYFINNFDFRRLNFNVCRISSSQIKAPNECRSYKENDANYENDYKLYRDYWTYVLSGLDKDWSFAYNTPSGCLLPNRLYDESDRLYDVEGKPKYLVQATAERLGFEMLGSEYGPYDYSIQRLSYELPLHTIAKFVKDVTVIPQTKVPVNNQNELTSDELSAIRVQYMHAFIEALKSDINENKIKALVDGATFEQRGSNIVISGVRGIKTQVVPVKDITITLDAAKKEATNTINALKNLTKPAKRSYVKRVKEATSIKDIEQVVKEAQTADLAKADAKTARTALEGKIKEATDIQNKDAYKYASPNLKDAFDTALSNAQQADINLATSAADLASVNSALDSAMGDLDGEDKVIDIRKAEALAKLTDYGIPDDGQDNPYRTAIINADDTDGINKVLVTLSKQLLGKVIRSANELKTNLDVKYTQASKATKEPFDTQLENATKIYDDNNATLEKLDGARDGLSKAMEALDGVAQVQLANKKTEAKGQLDGFGLSDKDKTDYDTKIKNANSETEVDNLLKEAQLTGAKTQAVQAVTDTASKKKDALKQNQGTSTKEEVEAAQGEVDTLANAAIKEIKNATGEDAVNTVNSKKEDAISKINGVVAKNAAKDKAKTTIQNLKHLDQNEKTTYYDQVDKATDQNGINKAVEDAKKADLDKVKDAAKKTIGDLKYLEPNEKDGYNKQVEQKTDEPGVKQVVDAAKAADLAKATAAKTAAKKTINDLKNLDQNAKDGFCKQVDQAKDSDGINKVVEDAKLADAKAKALKDIDKMNLTPQQKEAAKQAVNDATDTNGVTKAVNDAKDKEPKQDLSAAKTAAKETIKGLQNLDQNAKDDFCGKVDQAKDTDGINKVVEDAKLADAKAKALKDIDKMNLTPQQKKDAKQAVNDATDTNGVTKAVNDAKDKEPKQDLSAAKADAKKKINGLQNLEKKDKDDFCNKVDQASDKAGVDKVVEDAKLADAKAKALKDIDKMNLTPEQKEAAKKAVNDAKDTDSVTNAVNDAKDKEPKQDLSAAKADAKKKINGLQNLEKKDKDDFCNKVDQASDKAGVDKVVEAAKLADAKAKALKDIDKMNLTPEQKEAAKKAVNDAKDTDSVTNAVNDAKDKEPTQQEHVYVYDAGDIAESEAANATTMLYRLYNKWTHEHLFTTDKDEYDTLVAAGWTGEESAGMVAVNQGKGVYRLYNPNTGEHHYTTDENELAACVKAGWINEGIKFHSVQNGTVPVYSMYNPYEKKFYHHYTSDADEIAKMVKAGWIKEEIKWYAAK